MGNIEENVKERKEAVFADLKDDGKLLKIAFQRLWRDILRLFGCIELPKICYSFNRGKLKWLLIAVPVLLLLLLLLFVKMCGNGSSDTEATEGEESKPYAFTRVPKVERPEKAHRISNINHKRLFNDLNDAHLASAKKMGIKSLESRDYVDNASRKIVETNDLESYVVDDLTHSIPFLIPEAAELLSAIGNNFQDSLVMKHLEPHKVIVTSVLRTKSDIKRLGRVNVNSSTNSAHCYATTFDITYKRFFSEYGETTENAAKLKNVLGEVIRDLKNQGCCYVKHEVKQACFHITVRKSPNK